MKITTTELQAVFDLLMRHIDESGRSELVIPWDYYWDIPVEELYDPHTTPSNLDLGQLSEDWEKLGAIARADRLPVGYALTWLAAVLRAVGEQEFS